MFSQFGIALEFDYLKCYMLHPVLLMYACSKTHTLSCITHDSSMSPFWNNIESQLKLMDYSRNVKETWQYNIIILGVIVTFFIELSGDTIYKSRGIISVQKFHLIVDISSVKLLTICAALFKLVLIAFCLYCFGIFYVQLTRSFLSFLCTLV